MPDERASRRVEIAGETVLVAFDPEAGLWFVESSSVPGVAAEAETLEALVSELEVQVRAARLP